MPPQRCACLTSSLACRPRPIRSTANSSKSTSCRSSAIRRSTLLDGAPEVGDEGGNMHLTLTGVLIFLFIAGVCGAVGRAIAGGTNGGCLVSIAVGFIGSLLGSLIANYFHFPELWVVTVEHHSFPILWSIIGGALFVAFVHLLSGRSRSTSSRASVAPIPTLRTVEVRG